MTIEVEYIVKDLDDPNVVECLTACPAVKGVFIGSFICCECAFYEGKTMRRVKCSNPKVVQEFRPMPVTPVPQVNCLRVIKESK